MSRYANLESVSGSLKTTGGVLQWISYLAGIAGIIGGLVVGGSAGGNGMGVFVGFITGASGIVAGLVINGLGTLLAAAGEAMLALRDIAVQTNTTGSAKVPTTEIASAVVP